MILGISQRDAPDGGHGLTHTPKGELNMARYEIVRRYSKKGTKTLKEWSREEEGYYEVPYEEFHILGEEILYKTTGTEDFTSSRLRSLNWYEVKVHRFGHLNKGGYKVWDRVDDYYMRSAHEAQVLARVFWNIAGQQVKAVRY